MDREFQVTLSVRIPGIAKTEFVVEETDQSVARRATGGGEQSGQNA